MFPEENLFVVADGMGGHGHGEVASHLAVEAIQEFFIRTNEDVETTWPITSMAPDDMDAFRLVAAITSAHQTLVNAIGERPALAGMGTTVVASYFANSRLYLAHVGDSRCYCLRGDQLHLLTEDHSVLNELRQRFTFTAELEKDFQRFSHIITRALGVGETRTVEVELSVVRPRLGDIYVLCSDGLTGEVEDEEILQVLKTKNSPSKAAKELVRLANAHGGSDNTTAVVIHLSAGAQTRAPPPVPMQTIQIVEETDDPGATRPVRIRRRE